MKVKREKSAKERIAERNRQEKEEVKVEDRRKRGEHRRGVCGKKARGKQKGESRRE